MTKTVTPILIKNQIMPTRKPVTYHNITNMTINIPAIFTISNPAIFTPKNNVCRKNVAIHYITLYT
jgi:hypothetical protein